MTSNAHTTDRVQMLKRWHAGQTGLYPAADPERAARNARAHERVAINAAKLRIRERAAAQREAQR